MLRSLDPIAELGRLVRFGLIGFVNLFVYTGVTLVAIEGLGLSPVLGSLTGQVISTIVAYIGHFTFSFKAEPYHRTFLWRFMMMVAMLFATNIGMTWLLTDFFGLSHRISIVVLIIMIPLMSYLTNRYWVFAPGLRSPATTSKLAASSPRGTSRT